MFNEYKQIDQQDAATSSMLKTTSSWNTRLLCAVSITRTLASRTSTDLELGCKTRGGRGSLYSEMSIGLSATKLIPVKRMQFPPPSYFSSTDCDVRKSMFEATSSSETLLLPPGENHNSEEVLQLLQW